MRTLRILMLAGACAVAASGAAVALEVDPEVLPELNIGGRGLVTANYRDRDLASGGNDNGGELDVADSSLLLGFSKFLFNDVDYGFATIGFKAPDDDTDLGDDIFLHELHVGIGARVSELLLGRTRLTNTLIQFPTVRDDDLLDFTHVANASSNAEAEEDTIYGTLLKGSYYLPRHRVALAGAVTARTETDATNLANIGRVSRGNPNGISLSIAYDVPETIKFDRGLRFAGLTWDAQRAETFSGIGKDTVHSWIGALSYNLGENPEESWMLDVQGIYTAGGTVPSLAQNIFRARADSYAVVGSLRYVHRPYLQTRWQAALTAAYKDFTDFDNAHSIALIPSFTWRAGSGVDLVAQYRFIDNGRGLASAVNRDTEHVVLFGARFGFDFTLNETVGQRGSILNLEHDMLDIGPIRVGD
jgi:hypothetical protein